jgi:hypothetical protein
MPMTLEDMGCCCAAGPCEPVSVCLQSPCAAFGPQLATGVLIEVLSGSTVVASCTTTSNSECCVLTIPSSGNYTVKTSGNPRYVDTSDTYALTCGGSLEIPLEAADGYACQCYAMEPVPNFLTATGGSGSTTFSSTPGGAFTLPQNGVSVLIPGATGRCDGTLTSNPCATGTTLSAVEFIFNPDDFICNEIEQIWCDSTDCNQPVGSLAPPTMYKDGTCSNTWAAQWNPTPVTCFGYNPNTDNSGVVNFPIPQPTPINFTVTFPPGQLPAPIPSITITE